MSGHGDAHPYGKSTDRAQRRDLRRVRLRRLRVTQLIVFSILVIVIVSVGWYAWLRLLAPTDEEHVITEKDGPSTSEQGIVCPDPGAVPTAAKKVQVRVYNGTSQSGLAGSVSEDLGARGYRTSPPANTSKADGPITIVYGPSGYLQARSVAAQFPKATLRLDDREGQNVDVLIGKEGVSLVTKKTATAALQKPVAVPKGCTTS